MAKWARRAVEIIANHEIWADFYRDSQDYFEAGSRHSQADKIQGNLSKLCVTVKYQENFMAYCVMRNDEVWMIFDAESWNWARWRTFSDNMLERFGY